MFRDIYSTLFVGFIITMALMLFYRPSYERVRGKLFSNADDGIGSQIYGNDPCAKLCVVRNWFSDSYYIRSQKKTYYIGDGGLAGIKISPDKLKEISDQIEFDNGIYINPNGKCSE
jgi:hypothetical protein